MAVELFRRLRRDKSGSAAVEFGLTVPILLVSLLGVIDLGNVVHQQADLESAMRSGIQYFMSGGDDLTRAVQVVDQSWTSRPEGATVTTERFCMCGGAEAACNQLCEDDEYPITYNRVKVDVTFDGILGDSAYSSEQTVRVR